MASEAHMALKQNGAIFVGRARPWCFINKRENYISRKRVPKTVWKMLAEYYQMKWERECYSSGCVGNLCWVFRYSGIHATLGTVVNIYGGIKGLILSHSDRTHSLFACFTFWIFHNFPFLVYMACDMSLLSLSISGTCSHFVLNNILMQRTNITQAVLGGMDRSFA